MKRALLSLLLFVALAAQAQFRTPNANVQINNAGTLTTPASPIATSSTNVNPVQTVDTWVHVVEEGMAMNVSPAMQVRFGAPSSNYTTAQTLSGYIDCTRGFFGSDPAPGSNKGCDILVPAGQRLPVQPAKLPPPTFPLGTWTKVADEGGSYTLPGSNLHNTRYGAGEVWAYMQDSGAASCNQNYFNAILGNTGARSCYRFVPSTTGPFVATNGGPMIDLSKIPPRPPNAFNARITEPQSGPPNDNSIAAGGDDTAAFRTTCFHSHMLFDDPIVLPKEPGASHLHMFFGNTSTNAYSTSELMLSNGYSTCAGGILNRTGYWVPAMIDTLDGTPVVPSSPDAGLSVYYKSGYSGTRAAETVPFPVGLKMLAGFASNSAPGDNHYEYSCFLAFTSYSSSIPNCPVGSFLELDIYFPQCNNGQLDSPDHRSHMAYANLDSTGGCPSTHPIQITSVEYRIFWKVKVANTTSRWRLSSDNYSASQPGGYSAHGDWMYGWDPATMTQWVTFCETNKHDCHNNLLGNGRELINPGP